MSVTSEANEVRIGRLIAAGRKVIVHKETGEYLSDHATMATANKWANKQTRYAVADLLVRHQKKQPDLSVAVDKGEGFETRIFIRSTGWEIVTRTKAGGATTNTTIVVSWGKVAEVLAITDRRLYDALIDAGHKLRRMLPPRKRR